MQKNANFQTQKIDIKNQKIDGFILKIINIVLISFQIKNKINKSKIFSKIFLIINISIKMILGLFFLIFSKINILFTKPELI